MTERVTNQDIQPLSGVTVLRTSSRDAARVLAIVGAAGLGSVVRLAHGRFGALVPLLLLWALFMAAGVFRLTVMRVELRPADIVVVNWRRQRIPRRDIDDLATGRFLRLPRVWLLTGSGRRVPLLALDGRAGARDHQRFDADVTVLRDWLDPSGA